MSWDSVDAAIVDAILSWNHKWPYSPSFRDVSAQTGVALGTVHRHCRLLRESGKIEYQDQIARSLRVSIS
jgi:DNA-binding transcriptional regulator YhcF (GntR family)